VPHDGARHGPRLRNDEELADVDERGERAAQRHHGPARRRHLGPHGERVDKGDGVEQEQRGYGRLVEEELHRGHAELAVERGDPDGVEGRGEDAGEGEEDAEGVRGGGGGGCGGGGEGVVVGNHGDAEAGGDEGRDGGAREGGAVEDIVHEGDGRGQEDARDLVEGYGGIGEGKVWQDDVEGHGEGEGEDLADGGAARDEEREGAPREGEEGEEGDGEVEGGEGELGELEAGVGEDGFVGEDLGGLVVGERWGGGRRTMPIVARVLATIHSIAVVKLVWVGGEGDWSP